MDNFRPQRMKLMADFFGINETSSVLDVGGSWNNWSYLSFQPRLTILNLEDRPTNLKKDVKWIKGDARALPFKDNSFDLVYSNSVIEHLQEKDRILMALEMRRVSRCYYCQTPNYWFPIEPHFLTPFIHWLPENIRLIAIKHFSIRGILEGASTYEANVLVKPIHLLTESEMLYLFPDAHWMHEYTCGLKKSLIAVRRTS